MPVRNILPPYFFLYYLFLPIEYLLMLNIMVGATNVETAKKHGPSSRDIQVFWGRCHLTSAVIEMRVEDRRGAWGGHLALPGGSREDLTRWRPLGWPATGVFSVSLLPFILRGAKDQCSSSSRKYGIIFIYEGIIKV